MNTPSATRLRIGDWYVNSNAGEISRIGETLRMESRSMRLLVYLAGRANEVVSIEELLDHVWSGVVVTPDSVYQAVASLRRTLGDDPKRPAYIATVPRLGYRLVADVRPWDATDSASANGDAATRAEVVGDAVGRTAPVRRLAPRIAVLVALLAVLGAGYAIHRSGASASDTLAVVSRKSIAVLPFLDLTTQAMNEEYFADGMTEELIDHLSKLPGVQVPGATSSFYYKDKQLPVAEIARALGVAYVIDGSVRQSEATFRVAARLVRASDGFVLWTQTYDQPMGDVVAIQKTVADEITDALRATIGTESASATIGAH